MTLEVTALLCAQVLRVLVPLFYVCCAAPFARVFFLGVPFAEDSVSSLLKQGFTHSPLFADLKVSWVKFFFVRGFGPFDLCFLPVASLLGGKKVSSFFGIEIHYRSMD
jgi:hypothetical protein